jgi:hypothetical protein
MSVDVATPFHGNSIDRQQKFSHFELQNDCRTFFVSQNSSLNYLSFFFLSSIIINIKNHYKLDLAHVALNLNQIIQIPNLKAFQSVF